MPLVEHSISPGICAWSFLPSTKPPISSPAINSPEETTLHVEPSNGQCYLFWNDLKASKLKNRSFLGMFAVYSLHFRNLKITFHKQPPQNIWKRLKKALEPENDDFQKASPLLSIFRFHLHSGWGVSILPTKISRVPSSVPIWRARIATSEDASWFLDEYGPGRWPKEGTTTLWNFSGKCQKWCVWKVEIPSCIGLTNHSCGIMYVQ